MTRSSLTPLCTATLLLAISPGLRAEEKKPGDSPSEVRLRFGEPRDNSSPVKATVRLGVKVYCRVEIPESRPGNNKGEGSDLEGVTVRVNGKDAGSMKYDRPRELPYYLFEPTQKGVYEIKLTTRGVQWIDDDTCKPAEFGTYTYIVTVK